MPWQQGITQCDSVTKSTVSKVTHFLAFLVLEKLGWHSLSKWGMGLVDWLIGWLIGKWANKLPNFTLFPLLWLQFTVLHQFLWSWIQKCPSLGWNLSGAVHHCCYTTKIDKKQHRVAVVFDNSSYNTVIYNVVFGPPFTLYPLFQLYKEIL